jgi:hypothetical protein
LLAVGPDQSDRCGTNPGVDPRFFAAYEFLLLVISSSRIQSFCSNFFKQHFNCFIYIFHTNVAN